MAVGDKRLFEFGRFRLDVDERFLLNNGAPVALPPKAVELLIALVDKAGHVVSKDELMDTVWADAFVEEANLTQSIFVLRKALGETKNGSKFIETIPRRGYRFVCPVSAVHPAGNGNAAAADVQPGPAHIRESKPFSERWKSFFAPIGLIAVLVIMVGLVTNNFYRSAGQSTEAQESTPHSPGVNIRPLTSHSRAYNPAISGDGRLLAYKRTDGEDAESVWLMDMTAGSEIQIRPSSAKGYSDLTFSPDASELYYRVYEKLPDGSKRGIIMRSPLFGGPERKIAEQAQSNYALSPDGKHIAFIRSVGKPEDDRVLILVDTESGNERPIAKSQAGNFIFRLWAATPSWSPDGKRLIVCGQKQNGKEHYAALFEVRVEDGSVSEIASPGWDDAFHTVWLSDGSGLIVVAREKQNAPYQLWHLALPTGEAVRLTNDLHNYGATGYAPISNTLIVQQEIHNSHIWIVPGTDSDHARQLTSGTDVDDGAGGLDWLPDGRIIFSSDRNGAVDLWTMEADGSDLRRLTSESGSNAFPRVTADGRYIVFVSNRSTGKFGIWRMNIDGSEPMSLTRGNGETWPSISPDSQWVFYSNVAEVPGTIEKVSINGGEIFSVPNEPHGGGAPITSPDGKQLAYYFFSEPNGSQTGILPVTGGKTIKTLGLQDSRGFEQWTPDSRSLIYIKPGFLFSNLWRESIDGKEIEQLTHFSDSHIYYFAFSPDRKNLALARGSSFSDIVQIENFR